MNDSSLALGRPQFSDKHLAHIAATEGATAAWRQAIFKDAHHAASEVTGDFAIGLNEPGGSTFLAVDRFSIQTLCFRVVNGRLHFAARADELVDAQPEIDPQAIFDYLYFHVIPSPRTIYKDIYRLPPAHYALFKNGLLTVAPYWIPTFNEQRGTSFKVLKDEFRNHLKNAVSDQLDDDQPACFLSGGTDSSTVLGMTGLVSEQAVASYSIGFDANGYDEMAYARIAAKHFKANHHEYYVTPDDLVQSIPAVAASFDQPFGNSSALPTYFCAKRAREDGVTKLLAGDGGDELFGGNTRYAKQRIFGWYEQIPQPLRRHVVEPLFGENAIASYFLTKKAVSYVEQASIAMPERLQMYNLIVRMGISEVLTPQLLAQVDTQAPLRLQRDVWSGADSCSPLNQELAFDWRFTLADSDLPKVQGAARFAGIGVGFPMLDDRLLSFSLALPTEYKLKGLQLRWFFKEALRGFLPEQVITKKKQGFGLPFGVWANTHAGLNALATEALTSLSSRGIVRLNFIQSLMTNRLPEHPGYFGEMVWILMILEQWLQQHAPDFKVKT